MSHVFWLAVAAVAVVLVFDYTNGFHDAANIVATVIASRAMTPGQAVLLVGGFEFLGPLLGGTAVANTIGKFVVLAPTRAAGDHRGSGRFCATARLTATMGTPSVGCVYGVLVRWIRFVHRQATEEWHCQNMSSW